MGKQSSSTLYDMVCSYCCFRLSGRSTHRHILESELFGCKLKHKDHEKKEEDCSEDEQQEGPGMRSPKHRRTTQRGCHSTRHQHLAHQSTSLPLLLPGQAEPDLPLPAPLLVVVWSLRGRKAAGVTALAAAFCRQMGCLRPWRHLHTPARIHMHK